MAMKPPSGRVTGGRGKPAVLPGKIQTKPMQIAGSPGKVTGGRAAIRANAGLGKPMPKPNLPGKAPPAGRTSAVAGQRRMTDRRTMR